MGNEIEDLELEDVIRNRAPQVDHTQSSPPARATA